MNLTYWAPMLVSEKRIISKAFQNNSHIHSVIIIAVGLIISRPIEMFNVRKRFYKLLSICIYERISRLIASTHVVGDPGLTVRVVINACVNRI